MESFEQNSPGSTNVKNNFTDEVKNFYTGDFKGILIAFFKNPIDGILNIFKNPSEKSYSHALILYASVAVLYVTGGALLAGNMRAYMGVSAYLMLGLFPILAMLFITALSFGVKSISGKINPKDELLTGALCGIPLSLLIPGLFVAQLLGSGEMTGLMLNPANGGILVVLLFLYTFLMLINVFQQSLKASGTRDTLAWYLSPLCITLSIYLAMKIAGNLF